MSVAGAAARVLRSPARRVRGEQAGFGLPLTMAMILIALTFSGAAVSSTVQGLDQAGQDVGRKKAAAAARGGLRMGVYRLNQTNLDIGAALRIPLGVSQCLVKLPDLKLKLVDLTSSSWCAHETELGDGTRVIVQTSHAVNLQPLGALAVGTFPALLQRRIVATGIAGGERRRFYQEVRATGSLSVVAVLFLPVVLHAQLERYRLVPGTLRECTPVPTDPANPASGC